MVEPNTRGELGCGELGCGKMQDRRSTARLPPRRWRAEALLLFVLAAVAPRPSTAAGGTVDRAALITFRSTHSSPSERVWTYGGAAAAGMSCDEVCAELGRPCRAADEQAMSNFVTSTEEDPVETSALADGLACYRSTNSDVDISVFPFAHPGDTQMTNDGVVGVDCRAFHDSRGGGSSTCSGSAAELSRICSCSPPQDVLGSWNDLGGADPCAVGADALAEGWHGLQCDQQSSATVAARVTALEITDCLLTGSIEALAPLTSLLTLSLHGTQVTGDISSLATLVSLTSLKLHNTPHVTGHPTTLDPLVSLTWLTLHGSLTDPYVGVLATRGDTLAELHPNCHAGTYIDYRAVSGAATCEDCPVGKAAKVTRAEPRPQRARTRRRAVATPGLRRGLC